MTEALILKSEVRLLSEEAPQEFAVAALILKGSRLVVFDPETVRWFEVPSESFKLSASARETRVQLDSASFVSQQEARAFFDLAKPLEIGVLL